MNDHKLCISKNYESKIVYLIKSVIETIGKLYSNAKFFKLGKDAIFPSSTSTRAVRTENGGKPANATKSTEASV
jgi:hypothetical protein